MEAVIPNIGELGVVVNSRDADQIRSRWLLSSAALDIHLTARRVVSTGEHLTVK